MPPPFQLTKEAASRPADESHDAYALELELVSHTWHRTTVHTVPFLLKDGHRNCKHLLRDAEMPKERQSSALSATLPSSANAIDRKSVV